MKKYPFFLSLIFFLWACDPENSELPAPANPIDCNQQPGVCELTAANNHFGFDLFRRLHQEEPAENLFLSPFSISTALTMTLNGAAGQTYTDMHQTLAYDNLLLEDINGSYRELLTLLPQLDPSVTMQPANSIWYDLDFPVSADFLDVNEQFFNSPAQAVDFRDPATVGQINGWVSDRTGGKIDELLAEIPPNAVMYLINAIYFKGKWRWPLDPADTETADFERVDGTTVPVNLMQYEGEIIAPVFYNDLVAGIDLPFADSTFAMTLLLPHPESSVNAVVDELAAGAWPEWTAALAPAEVKVALPRFAMRYKKELNDVLKVMGMEVAFDPNKADFTKMGTDGLWISLVKHEAFIEVNEEGSEAGAATLVEISRESAALNELRFTRPFLFVIREVGSNAVLFAGKVMEPQE